MSLNKTISTPLAIAIIVSFSVLAGGIVWQYKEVKTETPEITAPEKRFQPEEISYPESYILQEDEIPLDFQYARVDETTLGNNPGYLEWLPYLNEKDYQGTNLSKIDKIYKGIYASENEPSPVYVWAIRYNTAEDLRVITKTIDTIKGFRNKTTYLDNGERILAIVEASGSVSGSDKFYKENVSWSDIIGEFVSRLEQKSDLRKISTKPQKRKNEAKKYINKALGKIEEAKELVDKAKEPLLYSRAVWFAKEATELDPKNPQIWFKRGKIYSEVGATNSNEFATRCYKNALRIDPDNSTYQEALEQIQ